MNNKSITYGGRRPQVLKFAYEERRVDRFLNLAHKFSGLGKEIFYEEGRDGAMRM